MNRLLLCALLFLIFYSSFATHIASGEITWRCIPGTGQFRFYMELYRSCRTPSGSQGASWQYNNLTLKISGSNLPRRANGTAIIGILMKPDSTKWINENFGEVKPDCNPNGPFIKCNSGQIGAFQRYFYISDPVTLNGVPPASGWHFYYQAPCCRSDFSNVLSGAGGTSNGLVLRAVMYPDAKNSNVKQCNSSSPRFAENISYLVCRDQLFSAKNGAYDVDLDSISFNLASPLTTPPPNGAPIAYNLGYSYDNPTPDSTFHPENIPLTIDPLSGQIKMKVKNNLGSRRFSNYLTVVQFDEWRDGVKIGSVFREYPIFVYDCDSLQNRRPNQVPVVSIIQDGDQIGDNHGAVVKLTAGQSILLDIAVTDLDSNFSVPQKITMNPSGIMFAHDFTDSTNCNKSVDAANNTTRDLRPCAILKSSSVVYDTSLTFPRFQISDSAQISTQFIWQTSCNQIKNSASGSNVSESHYFNLNIKDDHCPIPLSNSTIISINLKTPLPISNPIMKGVSVGLDGKVTYQWAPPTDTANTYDNYQVQQTNVPDGAGPVFGSFIYDTDVRRYAQALKIFTNYPIYVSSQDIRNKIPGQDWYFRMKTESGCSGAEESVWSESCRVIEVDASPNGPPNSTNSIIRLNWNRAKSQNAATDGNYLYESPTHFYIWQNDDVSTAAEARRESNWTLIDSTNLIQYDVYASNCNDYMGYRIEARDTVIIYKQGSRKAEQLFDTLYFSTFSTVDTILARSPQSPITNAAFNRLKAANIAEQYQWKSCETEQTLSSTNEYIPTDTGSYKLISTFKGGCIDSSNCYIVPAHQISVQTPNNQTLRVTTNAIYFQWIDCRADTIIPGATLRSFQPQDTGYYAVEVRTFGYKDTSDCIPMLAIGLNEIKSLEPQIDIFPNPTKNYVTIQTEIGIKRIEVRSMDGRIIPSKWSPQENTLQMPKEKGIYFIEIDSIDGVKISKKVVKI